MTPHLADTPVLQTERLVLRAPRMSDFPVWEAFFGSDRSRYVGGPVGKYEAWRAFGHLAGMWALKGVGSFVIERKSDGAVLGSTGPWVPEYYPEKELGWTLWAEEAEGKGYAFEAASAARDFAFGVLGWDTAVSYIDDGNDRSFALAERLGAYRDDAAPKPDKDEPPVFVYRHPKPGALQ